MSIGTLLTTSLTLLCSLLSLAPESLDITDLLCYYTCHVQDSAQRQPYNVWFHKSGFFSIHVPMCTCADAGALVLCTSSLLNRHSTISLSSHHLTNVWIFPAFGYQEQKFYKHLSTNLWISIHSLNLVKYWRNRIGQLWVSTCLIL